MFFPFFSRFCFPFFLLFFRVVFFSFRLFFRFFLYFFSVVFVFFIFWIFFTFPFFVSFLFFLEIVLMYFFLLVFFHYILLLYFLIALILLAGGEFKEFWLFPQLYVAGKTYLKKIFQCFYLENSLCKKSKTVDFAKRSNFIFFEKRNMGKSRISLNYLKFKASLWI